MGINGIQFKPVNVNKSHNVEFQGTTLTKPLQKDEFSLSSKVKSENRVAFGGILEKLFPPKVDKEVLDEYMSLVKNDEHLQKENVVGFLMPDKFQIVKIIPQDKVLHFELGFTNNFNKFYKKAEANVELDSAKLSYKSSDGLEYKTWEIRNTIDWALKQAIEDYKGY